MVRALSRRSSLLFLLALASASVAAQEMRRGGPADGLPPYNKARETSVSGHVTGLDTSGGPSGEPGLFVVNVTVQGQPFRLLLGPEPWVKSRKFTVTPGTHLTAVGVAQGLKFKGDPAMMVRQVTIGTQTFTCRDDAGTPLWEQAR
jgi:hypothetical protein